MHVAKQRVPDDVDRHAKLQRNRTDDGGVLCGSVAVQTALLFEMKISASVPSGYRPIDAV